MIERWRQRARAARAEVYATYLALRDPRVPWYAKVVAALIVAYAASPIDLIPDFIPVLGYADDLVILPLGVWLMRRLVPRPVLAELRDTAGSRLEAAPLFSRLGAALTIATWLLLLAALGWLYVTLR